MATQARYSNALSDGSGLTVLALSDTEAGVLRFIVQRLVRVGFVETADLDAEETMTATELSRMMS